MFVDCSPRTRQFGESSEQSLWHNANFRQWPWFLILFAAALGGGLTFPAQAVLMGRIVRAFELPAAEANSQGDFFSLMFFIVALANLLIYGSVGWSSVVVGQVCHLFHVILRESRTLLRLPKIR